MAQAEALIVGATFVLMYKNPADKAASQEALKFFDWAFKNGKQMAAELGYECVWTSRLLMACQAPFMLMRH